MARHRPLIFCAISFILGVLVGLGTLMSRANEFEYITPRDLQAAYISGCANMLKLTKDPWELVFFDAYCMWGSEQYMKPYAKAKAKKSR